MNILIINGSVRDGRATSRVEKWVENTAKQIVTGAEISTIDLKALDLPMFSEPILPMMNKDRAPAGSVKQWIDALESADGYVVVTPEYNHAMPSGLKNAIDYINFQVMKKPFLVVSHGANGGARAAEQVKQSLNANIGAVPVSSGVTINGMVGFGDMISETGEPQSEVVEKEQNNLENKLQELVWYSQALKNARS